MVKVYFQNFISEKSDIEKHYMEENAAGKRILQTVECSGRRTLQVGECYRQEKRYGSEKRYR